MARHFLFRHEEVAGRSHYWVLSDRPPLASIPGWAREVQGYQPSPNPGDRFRFKLPPPAGWFSAQVGATPVGATPALPLGFFRARFRCLRSGALPAFTGAAWRGALGFALRGIFCTQPGQTCNTCPLVNRCPYGYLMETTGHPREGGPGQAVPHPICLRVPGPNRATYLQPGETLTLEFTLIGRGNTYLLPLLAALERLDEKGLGADDALLRLERVSQALSLPAQVWTTIYAEDQPAQPLKAAPPTMPAAPKRVEVVFETPVHLRREGREVTPERFTTTALFANLVGRVSLLARCHTEQPLSYHFGALIEHAQDVRLHDVALKRTSCSRYSNRQQQRLAMPGLVGRFRLEGEALAVLWPYLWPIQWIGCGKWISMGMGRISLQMS